MMKYVEFARPFTLIAPMLGVISGALTAWGSTYSPRKGHFGWEEFGLIAVAALAAAILNAASNGVNQVYDLEIDRANKPNRPLVTGKLSHSQAMKFTIITYVVSVAMTWIVVPEPAYDNLWSLLTAPFSSHECIWFYFLAAIFTLMYSAPAFGRTKRLTFGANLTIAIPRGLMLKVAGWSVMASVWHVEPWYIGAIFFFFLIGAATTKDFSDMVGDKAGGCATLPNRFGVRRAAYMIAPCFVLPWLLIPLGLLIKPGGVPILSGDFHLLMGLGLSLTLWGSYTVYLMLRDPDALSRVENHPSWKHMYLMMFWAQIGFALAYIL